MKPYKINERTINQVLELKHGTAVKTWAMDKVSNAPFTDREYDRLIRVCELDNLKLPTKRQLEKKAEQMHKLVSQPMTEVCAKYLLYQSYIMYIDNNVLLCAE